MISLLSVKGQNTYTAIPSIDSYVLLRMLLIGYLYGIISERRLCEEASMHVGYRWFIGLNLDDKVPDQSTFSKNRHNRFKESGIFQSIFDEIVKRCMDKGLVSATHLSVDGSLIKANASIGSMEPIVVKMTQPNMQIAWKYKTGRRLKIIITIRGLLQIQMAVI